MPHKQSTWLTRFRDAPIKSITSILALITMIFTMGAFLDSRYDNTALASEIEDVKSSVSSFRKSFINDKIFELKFKKQQSENDDLPFNPLDAALLNRYEKEMSDDK